MYLLLRNAHAAAPDELRARLAAAQILGLLEALAVREDEALLAAPSPTLIGLYRAALDALIAPHPLD